jgi:hypothetical protein
MSIGKNRIPGLPTKADSPACLVAADTPLADSEALVPGQDGGVQQSFCQPAEGADISTTNTAWFTEVQAVSGMAFLFVV